MIRLFLIFLVLLGSVGLGTVLYHDTGHVYISFNQWTLETTLWVGVIALILGFALLHGLFNLIGNLLLTPSAFRRWREKRRTRKARAKTRRGLIEFSEGYWQKAENDLIKALPHAETPLFNYLIAARAAQEMGDGRMRDEYLRQAQQAMPDAKFAIELTQAQLQLANKQWEQALATLHHLKDLAPRHPYVLKLLSHLFREVKDWQGQINLLPQLKKYSKLSREKYSQLEQQAYVNAVHELTRSGQTGMLNRLMTQLPKALRNHKAIVVTYSNYLIGQNKTAEAEEYLRQSLQQQFNPEVIAIYGQLSLGEKQLAFAESLLKKNNSCPELLLCLGRLSLANQLYGKAKEYLNQSIRAKASVEAYEKMGELLEILNDKAGAMLAYRQGLAVRPRD